MCYSIFSYGWDFAKNGDNHFKYRTDALCDVLLYMLCAPLSPLLTIFELLSQVAQYTMGRRNGPQWIIDVLAFIEVLPADGYSHWRISVWIQHLIRIWRFPELSLIAVLFRAPNRHWAFLEGAVCCMTTFG